MYDTHLLLILLKKTSVLHKKHLLWVLFSREELQLADSCIQCKWCSCISVLTDTDTKTKFSLQKWWNMWIRVLLDAPTALRNAALFLGGTGQLGSWKRSQLLASWLGLSSELSICWFIQSNHWWWVCGSCCGHGFNSLTDKSLTVSNVPLSHCSV